MPEIQQFAPHAVYVARKGEVNAWDNEDFVKTVRATGKKTLLDVAVKAADFLCGAFENPTPELARNAVCPSHYMGTVELYRTTGEKKYLRLAVKFIDLRDVATAGDHAKRVLCEPSSPGNLARHTATLALALCHAQRGEHRHALDARAATPRGGQHVAG